MVSSPTGPEYTLTTLENKEYADVDDAMAALVTATVSVNRAIEEDTAQFAPEGFVGDLGDKLREIIRRLAAFVKKIATQWGAISYSIGVSLTGVSVSVEWAGPKR
jgi:hypothetical protein